MISSFLLLIILIFSFDKFRKDYLVYILTFGTVIGQVLFPQWFFQGMEKMKYITFLNILAKSIFTIAIFVFIHKENDYWKVPLINSLGFITIGIMSLWIIFKNFNINLKIPNLNVMKFLLKESWYVFVTSFQSNIISSSSVFILGIFSTQEVVGYYSAIEKLVKAFASLFSPLTRTFFPYISKKLKENKRIGISLILKITFFTDLIVFIFIIIFMILSKDILSIILGSNFSNYSIIMQILLIWQLFAINNNFLGIQFLIGSGYNKIYLKSFNIASIITLIIYFVFIKKYSYLAVTSGMLIGEITLTLCMIVFIKKYKLFV
jgi:PST family polysaccharide transporter